MAETDTQIQEVTLTRAIFSSSARVYAAFTSAEGWCEWCCEQAEVEAKIGGKLHIFTDGYNAYGEYTILDPDRAIAFTWDGDGEPPTLVHVSLKEQEHHTEMVFKITGLESSQDWAEFAAFLERTWGHALDNLKAVLEKKSGA